MPVGIKLRRLYIVQQYVMLRDHGAPGIGKLFTGWHYGA